MSESYDSSYYEVALTNRQVLVFFVILLACLLGAFFSGVWVGREGAIDRAQTRVAQVEQPAQAEAAVPALEELKFFSDEEDPPRAEPRSEPPPPPRAERNKPPRREPARQQPPAERRVEPEPTSTLAQDVGVQEPPARAREPEPVKSEPAPARTEPAEAVAASEPAADGVVIQVFSSRDAGQARKVLARLVGGGYTAFLSPVEVDGQTMHRVRIGPFRERQQAETVALEVRQSFDLDTWITQ